MEIEHKIKIYSKEAYLVVSKITVGKSKRTLFSSAISKEKSFTSELFIDAIKKGFTIEFLLSR